MGSFVARFMGHFIKKINSNNTWASEDIHISVLEMFFTVLEGLKYESDLPAAQLKTVNTIIGSSSWIMTVLLSYFDIRS